MNLFICSKLFRVPHLQVITDKTNFKEESPFSCSSWNDEFEECNYYFTITWTQLFYTLTVISTKLLLFLQNYYYFYKNTIISTKLLLLLQNYYYFYKITIITTKLLLLGHTHNDYYLIRITNTLLWLKTITGAGGGELHRDITITST